MRILCLRQVDLKCFVAYTSVAHIGLVVASFFKSFGLTVSGGTLIMLAHGICSSGLFYHLTLFYERFMSRRVILIRGGYLSFGLLYLRWFMLCIGRISSPPSFNFFSEVMMLLGLLRGVFLNMIIMFFIMLLAGVYSIYLFVVFMHGVQTYLGVMVNVFVVEFLLLYLHLVS